MTDEAGTRQLLDLVTQGVIETTAEGEILLVNKAFAQLLGYESPEELLSSVSGAGDLYAHSAERPGAVERATHGTPEDSHAREVRRKDGSLMWIHGRVIPTLDEDGRLVRMAAVVDPAKDHPLTQEALEDAVQRIEAHERALLAEAIHDEPLQLIAAALLRLDSLQRQVPEPAVAAIDQVASLLSQSSEQLRRLITTLAPPDLGAGLTVVLRDLAHGIFLDGRTSVEVNGPESVPLSTSTASVAYLVLREALVNARKHARAQHVVVEIIVEPYAVLLSVTDDGDGAGAGAGVLGAGTGHLGVPTMRARAQAIGADLAITSAVGTGTTMTLRVPRHVTPAPVSR